MGGTTRWLAVGGFLLAALGAASARADVRIAYEVDQKVFKKGTASDDLLTFSLFDDDACTSEVHVMQIEAGDPSLSYDQPKRARIKGGPKPPKVTVIGTVLDPGGVSGELYATVTGGGIVPVGPACQLQATAEPFRSVYRHAVGLNGSSGNAATTPAQLQNNINFTKQRDDTSIEMWMNTRAYAGVFAGGATAVYFQLRVDSMEPDFGGTAVIRDSGEVQFISATAVFEDLPAGSYSATLWFWTNTGTSSGVLLDPGGYRGHVVLKESD